MNKVERFDKRYGNTKEVSQLHRVGSLSLASDLLDIVFYAISPYNSCLAPKGLKGNKKGEYLNFSIVCKIMNKIEPQFQKILDKENENEL